MTRVRLALGLIAAVGATHLACGFCGEPPKVRSGTYILLADGTTVAPGYEWLVGSEIVIDLESGTATIRYMRDGTAYDAQFELVE